MTWLPSFTRRFRCPEGKVFVTIVQNLDDGMPYKIWATCEKAGNVGYAAGYGLGALARLALRSGASIRDVVRYLRGISHAESNDLAYEASSVADAIARTLEEQYL